MAFDPNAVARGVAAATPVERDRFADLTTPGPGTPVWWALRPLWVLVPAALLVPLVACSPGSNAPARPCGQSPASLRGLRLRSPTGGPGTGGRG